MKERLIAMSRSEKTHLEDWLPSGSFVFRGKTSVWLCALFCLPRPSLFVVVLAVPSVALPQQAILLDSYLEDVFWAQRGPSLHNHP